MTAAPASSLALSLLTAAVAVASFACAVADAQRGPPVDGVTLQPIAPPLTRIRSLGDAPLASPPPPGRPKGPPKGPPPGPPPTGGGAPPAVHILRVQVEADASAMAEVLGPERVAAALRHREALSAFVGEGATWDALLPALEAAARPAAP